jgi:hypothetical protein
LDVTTPRENLLSIFRHEVPGWVPITGHIDRYNQPSREGMDPDLAEALGEVQWQDTSAVTWCRYLGLEIMDWYGLPGRISTPHVAVEETVEGDVKTVVRHTLAGDLREVIRTCRDVTGAVSSNHTEHMVKGPEDLPALAALFEDEVVELDAQDVERARERRELIGDDGLLLGPMPGTPLGMMYRSFSGVATLAYLWADAPDALRDCFMVMEAAYLKRLQLGVQTDIDVVVSVDDTSTTAISPPMFEACNLDLTNARADAAHAAGKLYFHHSCGHIRNLLPLYRQTRMDAVHAYNVPPTGDVTVAQGREMLGDRITIMASIGGQLSSPRFDRTAACANARQVVREAAPYDHFILGLSSWPHRTVEEMKFVLDCCRELSPRPA